MRLIDELERIAAGEESPFRAQLLREDAARLRRLQALAGIATDSASFKASGMRIGWTQGDARTSELAEPLERLLDAVYAFCHGAPDTDEARVIDCWNALHRTRMERLLGCLSTPVPKPVD